LIALFEKPADPMKELWSSIRFESIVRSLKLEGLILPGQGFGTFYELLACGFITFFCRRGRNPR
jgi:hypothetical protein